MGAGSRSTRYTSPVLRLSGGDRVEAADFGQLKSTQTAASQPLKLTYIGGLAFPKRNIRLLN